MMSKKICLAFLLCTYNVAFSLYAQNTNLVPKDVYVGDEAEIRFSFAWEGSLLLSGEEQPASTFNSADLSETLEDEYTIKAMHLMPSTNGYVLSIVFIPWKAGDLNLPPFDLSMWFDISTKPLLIDIPEVYIQSILEKTDEKNIRPPAGPVIIPGTTYVVFGIIGVILIFFVLIFVLIGCFTSIKTWLKVFFSQIWTTRNFKKTCRDLNLLEKQSASLDSSVFAAKLSAIVRRYLQGRFAHPFAAETTSCLMTAFDTLLAGTGSSKVYACMQELCEICARCDFLQYAGIEVERAPFSAQEGQSLIDQSKLAFIYFEKNDGSDDDKGET